MDELAVVRASADRLKEITRETALAPAGEPWYRLVRLELSGDGLTATKPAGGSGPPYRVQYDVDFFESFEGPAEPCLTALGAEGTLQWLDWLDSDRVTARFLGDADEGVARRAVLQGAENEVEVGPLPTDVVDPDLSSGTPANVRDGTLVLDGSPAPTRIETDGATLERLVDAAAIVADESVPVVVRDGQFRLAVVGETMRGRGTLPATVEGPDCENRYGDDLAAVARVLVGRVELQVVPGGPLAVVQETAHASRHYVFTQSM